MGEAEQEVLTLLFLTLTTLPRDAHPTGILPVGGRLKWFSMAWERICMDRWVLDVVREGYTIEFTLPPPQGGGRITPVPSDPVKRVALEEELRLLFQRRAVVPTTGREGPLFLSSFFLTPS